MIPHLNKKMGLATKHQFNSSSYLHGFKFTNIDYMVYPIDNGNMNHLVDTSTRIGLIPSPKFNSYTFSELFETKNIAGLLSSSIVEEYTDATGSHRLLFPVVSDDHYVLSSRFYIDAPNKSVIEILTKDYIKGNSIDRNMLNFVLERYKMLGRLEQFYYGPILMTILKDVVRNIHI
jgi:hypothetical protein